MSRRRLGNAVVEVTGGAPGLALNRLTGAQVDFWQLEWLDAVTVHFTIRRSQIDRVRQVVERAQCELRILQEQRPERPAAQLLHRPVLLFFLTAAALAALLLPRFVFFYEVRGNVTVPSEKILRQLQELGIGFGTYGPKIRPHWIKNQLLAQIPELQWVTVTQNGCRATVTVRERSRAEPIQSQKGCAHIVAARSGVITSQSVLAGQALHQVGDTVVQGELLVSGIVDLERVTILEHAHAEIFARTWQKNQTVIPIQYTGKGTLIGEKQCIWLIFGNRRIKIFGNSGISHGSCDKMIETLVWKLPGGFALPVQVEIEHFRYYTPEVQELTAVDAQALLQSGVRQRALARMQAGEILQEQWALRRTGGVFRLYSTLECHEMIARSIPGKADEDVINDRTYSQRRENGADH